MRYDDCMKPHFEKVPDVRASFFAVARRDRSFPFNWHYHPEFELTLILDSTGQRLVGDNVADYGPGDFVLLGPNLPHSWRSDPMKRAARKPHTAIFVQFRQEFLGKEFFSLEEMEPITRLLKRSACGLAFGHTEIGRSAAHTFSSFLSLSPTYRVLTLLSILADLARDRHALQLSTDQIRPMCRVEDQKRIDFICIYLNNHFAEEIDFSRLARDVHMNQAALCRFFRRATGRTMTSYLHEIRIAAAAQLLKENRSILEIGLQVGFGSYSHFNTQFKAIKGHGPRAFRQYFLSKESRLSR